MNNTFLIELLEKFSKQELQHFRAFAHTDYFNTSEKVRRLCDYVLKEKNSLSKQHAYEAVFQSVDYKELRLNNVISDLLQLAYRFLVQQHIEGYQLKQQSYLMEALMERNLHRPLPRIIKKATQVINRTSTQSHQFFQDSYAFYEQLDRFALIHDQRSSDANLQKMSDTLDAYYLCNKFRIACEMVNRSAVLNGAYEFHFIAAALEEYERSSAHYQSYPSLQIYYQAYQFLTQASQKGYVTLKNLLQEHASLLPQAERRHLYTYMLNFSVRQINFGRSEYYQELLELFKVLIEQNLLLQHGYLTMWSFINATTAGIRLGAYQWTEAFIKRYQHKLKTEERQNTIDHQLAALYFAKGDFSKTLQLLQKIEFNDVFYQASTRIIQLKVFYELEETEPFYALVKSLKNLLRRKRQLNEYHRLSYTNFVRTVKRLLDLKLKPLYQIRAKHLIFQEKLEALEPLNNKEWLRRKYEELMERI
ncbi:MAG: hypothetical protein AAF849_25165 [Bacteroidota bacterium]